MSSVAPISSQTIDPNALRDVMHGDGKSEAAKIDAAATQFEAILIREFMGEALKPMIAGGALDEDYAGADTYRYFMVDTLSQSLASQGVFGIGKQISAQLKLQRGTPIEDLQNYSGVNSLSSRPAPQNGTPLAINQKPNLSNE